MEGVLCAQNIKIDLPACIKKRTLHTHARLLACNAKHVKLPYILAHINMDERLLVLSALRGVKTCLLGLLHFQNEWVKYIAFS